MEIFIVLIICILQIVLFGVNCYKLQRFKNIFPDAKGLSINTINGFVQGINSKIVNPIFKVILSSINKYLSNNKGQISDYHLIKDIVDRNTDAKEDEISTLIPIPLYLGLVGTMACILIGLLKLDLSTVISESEKAMVDGISPLLLGVAVAMITSTLGIILTTIGSYIAKNSRAKVEENKNAFLSWMQEKLLPQLSNDTASVLQKMTQELSDFNKTFAFNNNQFKSTLSKVVDTSDKQAELITLISQLQDKNITTKNLELLKLLEKWIANLHGIKDYNDLLLKQLVNISNYFKAEREQIEMRKTLLAETLNKADSNSIAALEAFNENFSDSLQKIQETFESNISEMSDTIQNQQDTLRSVLVKTLNDTDLITNSALATFNKNFTDSFQIIQNTLINKISEIGNLLFKQQETIKIALDNQNYTMLQSIENQQKAITEKLQDTTKFIEELNKIGDKIESITRLEKAMREQNRKISDLSNIIIELAKRYEISNLVKISVIVGGGIIVLYCLLEFVLKILSLTEISLFRI